MRDIVVRNEAAARQVNEPRAYRILCAADLTSRSDPAIARAVLLARHSEAEIMFVHAVSGIESGRVMRMKIVRAHARLLSQVERVMEHAPDSARVSVRVGTPIQAIVGAAAEWTPDLIVMARPHRRPMDFAIGTTAERVIRATRSPVLIVSRQPTQSYQRVVIATDLSDTSVKIARTIASTGVLREAQAWVVHAFEPPYYGTLDSSAQAYAEAFAHHPRVRLDETFLEALSDHGVELSRVEAVVQPMRPFKAIERCLERTRAELLVIGTSRLFLLKRLLFGSVADEVLRRVDCDVLAISPRARKRSGRAPVEQRRERRPAKMENLPLLHI